MDASEVLLWLVRIGLGKGTNGVHFEDGPWKEVLELADAQGVSAIAADGLEKSNAQIPFRVKMDWVSRLLMHEKTYKRHEELMLKLTKIYHKEGFRMMILKGWGVSLDYPIPSHRPSGDLDIWNFGQWKEADAYIASQGIEINNSHHHHSVFKMEELTVENHYDFINTHAHRSSKYYEARLKELASRNYSQKEVDGVTVYLPSADFNFLFLLRHMANHFVGKEMTLRQLLDWALLVEHHHSEMDWNNNLEFLKKNGLFRYFNLMALISVERLGFNPNIFHYELLNDNLKERVFNDIIKPEFNEPLGKGTFNIIYGKTRRWWSNRWKHRLCYPDSLLSAFVYSVWAKIQKPSHFIH